MSLVNYLDFSCKQPYFNKETSSFLLGVVCLFLFFTKKRLHANEEPENNLSPPSLNIIGFEALKIVASNQFPLSLLQWSKELGPIFRLQVNHRYHPMIVVSGEIELTRQVLTDKTSLKSDLYDVYKLAHSGGNDIFTSEGQFWQHSRKAMSPAFSAAHLKRMNETVIQENSKLEEKLDLFAQRGESFDVGHEMMHLTLSVITKTSFQYDLSQEEEQMLRTELDIVFREVTKGWIPMRWRFGLLFPDVRRARKAGKWLLAFGIKVLETYRNLESPLKGTVIDLIAKNKQYKDDKERASDILVLLVAGYDTTAFTLTWTLLELARNPIEQSQLRKELKSYPFETRTKSVKLNCVIKESMRLRAVLPLGSPREIARDILIQKNDKNGLERDFLIPKKSLVICPQILLNLNPNYHKDPDVFKPSRWINPSLEASSSLMPFALGRRNCIGQSLAMVEITNVLSKLCVKYEFDVDDEGTLDFFLTQKPVHARLFVSKAS